MERPRDALQAEQRLSKPQARAERHLLGLRATSKLLPGGGGASGPISCPSLLTMYEGKIRTRLCLPQGHWGSSRRFGS